MRNTNAVMYVKIDDKLELQSNPCSSDKNIKSEYQPYVQGVAIRTLKDTAKTLSYIPDTSFVAIARNDHRKELDKMETSFSITIVDVVVAIVGSIILLVAKKG